MAISAQDKIMYVANKLGLSTLKDMQGSTGAVYDADVEQNGTLFANCSQHQSPGITNLNQNKFEVNEALLIESITFYVNDSAGSGAGDYLVEIFMENYGVDKVIVFDLIIGNKKVMKDTPVFAAGQPMTFASVSDAIFAQGGSPEALIRYFRPRHQIFLEGAGILIPPQIEWSINYKIYSLIDGSVTAFIQDKQVAASLFGTRVLLNFNTSI